MNAGSHAGVAANKMSKSVSLYVVSLAALLVARPAEAQFNLIPQWSYNSDPEPPSPFGPLGRSAASSPSRAGSGEAQPFSQSSFSSSFAAFPPASTPFSSSSARFSQPHSPLPQSSQFQSFQPFSPPHISGSGFGPLPETHSTHSTNQYEECPYGTVCVDEYQCPPYGRAASAEAIPRTFDAFNQPHTNIQSGLDSSFGHGASSHDSGSHGSHKDSCGYNKVCCKKQFVPPHHQHGGPPPCHGPYCAPLPHLHHPSHHHGGGYGSHFGYGGHGLHGGHGGHLSYGAHSGYQAYPTYPDRSYSAYSGYGHSGYGHSGYGHSGYAPGYPTYGYSQYPPYHPPYFHSYQPHPYPPHQPYPPNPFSGAHFVGPHSHFEHSQADSQGSQTPEADAGQRTAPTSRTSRIFL